MWSETAIKALRALKREDRSLGFMGKTDSGDQYRIRAIGRGELAFYELGERATYVEILPGHGTIFSKSIRRWDDNKKIAPGEKDQIIRHMSEFLRSLGADKVTVA